MRRDTHNRDRGQAYTLEAVVSGLVVLSAFLFAIQSLIITPTTTSAVDPEVRTDLRQQADDIMTLTLENDSTDLSFYVRYWDQNRQTFAGAANSDIGYGVDGPPGDFGTMLRKTFTARDRSYNIEVVYPTEDLSGEREQVVMVDQGTPAEGAVTTSRVIILYDNQTLTTPTAGRAELWEYGTTPGSSDGYYPIPNAVEGPVYNVVEVRLTVW